MSYFSNILTATKTRYATLRQGDEADGDTEDDSHISRALRTYYLETHRSLPEWLPPAPNARSASPVTSLRNTYGRRAGAASGGAPPPGPSPASLSDIWDAPEKQPRGTVGRNASSSSSRSGLFGDDGPPGGGGSISTAQQRIKERLWGSRGTASPPPAGTTPPPPPPQGRVEMPMGPLEMPMGPAGGQPYMGAGMPWDDGAGGGYNAPAAAPRAGSGGGNVRRGAGGRVGLPSGPKDGRPPYR